MKIITAVTNCDFSNKQIQLLEKHGEFLSESVTKLEGEDLIKHIGDADIAIIGSSGVQTVSNEVLAACPNLKFISVFGSGIDFIDLDAASQLGIKVSNLQGANSQSVAEHTWGMILGLSKQITKSHNGAKDGDYSFLDYLGIELQGKTLGIIGYGEIGTRVAKIAKGFDMEILTHSRTSKESPDVEFVLLEDLLKRSDVITISIPLTKETTGIIGATEFDLMKNSAILINTSREALIQEDALIKTLEANELFGFGMELEINMPPNPELYKFNNVIITPHNGMFTNEAEDRCSSMVIDNVIKFIEGNPINLVN